jgi:predicted ATPase
MPQYQQLLVFLGGFDLDAAQAVAGAGEVERHQVLDLLTLLIDKSLVVAENASGPSRYRLLETVRQYAQESSANLARQMPSATVTASTTRRWRRRPLATNSG